MIEMIALVWLINFPPKEKVYPKTCIRFFKGAYSALRKIIIARFGINSEPTHRRRVWFGPAGGFCFCKVRVYENSRKKEKTRR